MDLAARINSKSTGTCEVTSFCVWLTLNQITVPRYGSFPVPRGHGHKRKRNPIESSGRGKELTVNGTSEDDRDNRMGKRRTIRKSENKASQNPVSLLLNLSDSPLTRY
jgi:hypothetical protein